MHVLRLIPDPKASQCSAIYMQSSLVGANIKA